MFWGFTSATSNMSALDTFIPDNSPNRTLFSITTGLAADLAPYSAFPGERELLIPAGHVFEVVNVKRFSRSAPTLFLVLIQLRMKLRAAAVALAIVLRIFDLPIDNLHLTVLFNAATSPSWSSRRWPIFSASRFKERLVNLGLLGLAQAAGYCSRAAGHAGSDAVTLIVGRPGRCNQPPPLLACAAGPRPNSWPN